MKRCEWCGTDPLYAAYHDEEWGIPLHDDNLLFEAMILDGAQAGLSWLTILRKRENYRKAFHDFDFERIARYEEADIRRLMGNAGIVRNRLKIESAVHNARLAAEVRNKYGSLDSFLWRYVDGVPIQNAWKAMEEIPTRSELSDRMSADLKKQGFKFFGSTICYAFMQAVGMINDHAIYCFRHKQVSNYPRRIS